MCLFQTFAKEVRLGYRKTPKPGAVRVICKIFLKGYKLHLNPRYVAVVGGEVNTVPVMLFKKLYAIQRRKFNESAEKHPTT